jgi:Carboxypeptidase regulatory-like domain/TonB dependent receptor
MPLRQNRNKKRRASLLLWLSLLCMLAGSPLLRADDGPQSSPSATSISGVVLDASSSVIRDAQVLLFAADGQQVREATTDPQGAFHFDNLPRGKYKLQVQATGFNPGVVEFTVGSKANAVLRISLTISTLSETVNVRAEDAALQVSTDVGENQNANNIDRAALDRVPVFDQDYITTLSRFLSDDTIGTNGVALVVNGLEANGPGVSASAIQEIKINQDPYSARFSRPGRARLEITTKPGTPEYHGTVNFLVRNSVFDARNAFALTKPPESRYFTEGSLSGPLGPNKRNTFLLSLEQDDDNLQAVVFAHGVNDSVISDNVPAPQRHFFGALRVFHDFANGDQLWIAYSYEYQYLKNQGVGGLVLREAGYNSKSTEQEINANYRKIFSPKWVNQLRFLVGHNDEPVFSVNKVPMTVVEGYFTGGGAQADSKRTEAHFEGTDMVTYTSGKHLVNFGIESPDLSRRGADDFTYAQGAYTFADINAYVAGQPSNFRLQTGNGHLVFWERNAAGFFEDNIRLKPNLSVTLGLRYYYQNYFHNDTNNFAPRFGFAYSPGKHSKFVFRGGAGMFYDRSGPRAIADLLHFNGVNLLRFLLPNNPSELIPYPVTPTDLQGVPTSVVELDPRAHIPYSVHYSFGIERQVTAKSTFSATYVGNRGIDLFRSRDVNAPPPPLYVARTSMSVGQDRQIESGGYQKSNSLELTFRGRPNKYFSGQAQYTLGKTYNNTSGITYFPGNSYYPWLDWARSDNDRRHKFDLLGTFTPTDLFSLGVALQAYSGKPVNVITGLDSNGDGVFNDRPAGGLAPRNSLHGPNLINLDVNVEHDFHFRKEKKQGPVLTVGLNVFNVLNRVNDTTYNGVIGPDGGPRNPNFGQPSAAFPARRFQVNLEYKF